jgi:2-keto-4-pentenoate hydratase/2-oxohepta-3-ene-1,7-dioic acid hydratase in catechol pathway
VVATGTPAGTGSAHGRFLAEGDEMTIEIGALGRLTNPVLLASR